MSDLEKLQELARVQRAIGCTETAKLLDRIVLLLITPVVKEVPK
jgi:hypothetical protein